jgi:hypothetical protein
VGTFAEKDAPTRFLRNTERAPQHMTIQRNRMAEEQDDRDLINQLAEQLRHTGGFNIAFATDQDLARYRRAAREIGTLLKRPVRTAARRGFLYIALADWGKNPLEAHLEDTRTRNAVDTTFRLYPDR